MMAAQDDRPTPIPMSQALDECATQTYTRPPALDGGAVRAAWASPNRDAAAQARPLSEAPPRDTIVDPPPSRWTLFRRWLVRLLDKLSEAIREPQLSDHLPPTPAPLTEPQPNSAPPVSLSERLPAAPAPRAPESTRVSRGGFCRDERGEYLLLEIWRVPAEYQRAAGFVAGYVESLRDKGADAYEDALVHFTLSRTAPNANGVIPVARLQDVLCDRSYERTIKPALLRLESKGMLEWVAADNVRPGQGSHVRLLVRP